MDGWIDRDTITLYYLLDDRETILDYIISYICTVISFVLRSTSSACYCQAFFVFCYHIMYFWSCIWFLFALLYGVDCFTISCLLITIFQAFCFLKNTKCKQSIDFKGLKKLVCKKIIIIKHQKKNTQHDNAPVHKVSSMQTRFA